MKTRKPLISTLLIIILLIVGFEIYFRVQYPEELKDQCYPLMYKTDSVLGYTYIPNTIGKISKPGISEKVVKINSQGFVGPEFETKKGKDIYRIIVVGSSTAGGVWMDGTESFTKKLQKICDEKEYKVEVINCAIDGLGRGKFLINLIKTKIVKYKPDLVLFQLDFPLSLTDVTREVYRDYILEYPINSDKDRTKGKEVIDKVYEYGYLKHLYDYSYIIRGWCKYYLESRDVNNHASDFVNVLKTYKEKIMRSYEGGDWERTYSYNVKKTIALYQSAQDTLKASNSKMALLHYYGINEDLEAFLEKNQLKVISLECDFKDEHVSWPNNHLNDKGHELLAQALFQKLDENEMISSSQENTVLTQK
jgi:hypothetical protein